MRSLLLAAACAALATPAASQQGPSLWDLVTPERILQRLVQGGIMALRSQVDLTYGNLTVQPMLGQVALSDVTLWPIPGWSDGGDCQITIDRLIVRSAALDETSRLRLVARASGLGVGQSCIDPAVRPMLAAFGQKDLTFPRATLDLDYDIASSAARAHVYTLLEGMAAADLTADFSYAWFDGRDDPENPVPVVYLSAARLSLENLGGWERAAAFLPKTFTDPATAGVAARGVVAEGIAGMPGTGTGQAAAVEALLDDVEAGWPAFLAAPDRLVLGTGFDPAEPVYLDFAAYEASPGQMIADLEPRLGQAARSAVPEPLPAAQVERVLAGAEDVTQDDRRTVGIALLTGQGAPRHMARGREVLLPLAEAGDGVACLALSRSLGPVEPELAYRLALVAGATDTPGAVAQIDALEAELPLAKIIELQDRTTGEVTHPAEALASRALIREQAEARMQGRGEVRSYRYAALWANLGAALGDAEAALILEVLDERARLEGAEAIRAWREVADGVSSLALEAWVQRDLPALYGAE